MAIVAALAATTARATDPPPAVVASFTRRVQPLVLNRCAAGACHGRPESPAPRFQRPLGGAQPDRLHTLANLEALLETVGSERDARQLAALLAAGHPRVANTARRAAPLTTSERVSLDRWLAEVRAAAQAAAPADPGVTPVAAEITEPSGPQPNRFRTLLDAAANPPPLPPPEEPRGVIFKNDVPAEE